jgi:hypothetical protein
MIPDASLVRDLAAYDSKLRIRWGLHAGKFLIERHQPASDPRLANATPPSDDAPPIRKDLFEGWREGYVHVLSVPRELAHWQFIAPELARLDAWRQGGMKEINRQLDADAEKWDAQTDKQIDHWAKGATDDAYERMAWADGRRVAVTNPELEYADSGFGFKVRDRRIA